MFKNSNSNGCPIVAYKFIKVIDNITSKTLTEEEYINIISLNTARGNLNIFKFNQPLDYSLFLSASFDGINWLSVDSKNTRNIRLVIQEDRKSLSINSVPYFSNPISVMQIKLFPNSQDLLEIPLPEVIDNENDKILVNFT